MALVDLRLGEGRALIGSASVPVAMDAQGRLSLTTGLVLRPLGFGERWRICRLAATAPGAAAEVARAIGMASAVAESDDGGTLDDEAVCLALHIAGAEASRLGFGTVASLLARSLGWSPDGVAAAEAAEADTLAEAWRSAVSAADADGGWTKVVFAGAALTPSGMVGPKEAVASMAASLLARCSAPLDLSLLSAAAPVSVPEGAGPRQAAPRTPERQGVRPGGSDPTEMSSGPTDAVETGGPSSSEPPRVRLQPAKSAQDGEVGAGLAPGLASGPDVPQDAPASWSAGTVPEERTGGRSRLPRAGKSAEDVRTSRTDPVSLEGSPAGAASAAMRDEAGVTARKPLGAPERGGRHDVADAVRQVWTGTLASPAQPRWPEWRLDDTGDVVAPLRPDGPGFSRDELAFTTKAPDRVGAGVAERQWTGAPFGLRTGWVAGASPGDRPGADVFALEDLADALHLIADLRGLSR